jgi:hypothetical protein
MSSFDVDIYIDASVFDQPDVEFWRRYLYRRVCISPNYKASFDVTILLTNEVATFDVPILSANRVTTFDVAIFKLQAESTAASAPKTYEIDYCRLLWNNCY